MTKRSLLIVATSCFIAFAPAAYGRSAYDGSWDLIFVTQRGTCDSRYTFYCRCDQRECHASQSRKIARLRRKVRRGSRFGDGPRQICRGCGQIVRNVRSGDLERPFRNGAMLRLLDGAPQLKDATAGARPARPRANAAPDRPPSR